MAKDRSKVLKRIEEKYEALGQEASPYLEGLVWQKPVNYWEYIDVDTLLNLQKARTDLPDEEIFIMYHQVTELFFKMILNEIRNIAGHEALTGKTFDHHLERIGRYIDILTLSFDIMRDGMEVEQYMKFRNALTPASGFQSAQYRKIEFGCTDVHRLLNKRVREERPEDISCEEAFDELYWQDAGRDHRTGEKNLTLRQFEEKYRGELIAFAGALQEKNLRTRYRALPDQEQSEKLKQGLRKVDHKINVEWPLVHLRTAEHYLESGGGTKKATGGSEWKKYLHPAYQRRIFFPELWSEQELENWGQDEI